MSTGKPQVREVTEDQKQQWREALGQIRKLTVKLRTGEKVEFIVGQPTRTHLDIITKHSNDGKQGKVREVLEENCILAGDVSLLKDSAVANTVYDVIFDMLDKLEVEVGEA